MLEGLRSHIFTVPDLQAAKEWYTALLGFPPYFDEPFYVGFSVGGYELGLMPLGSDDHASGSVTYWAVSDIEAAYARLIQLGAVLHVPITDVGSGIRLGSVQDPAGNVIGVIFNPHFSLPTS